MYFCYLFKELICFVLEKCRMGIARSKIRNTLTRTCFLLLCFFISAGSIQAQNGCFEIHWEENYGGSARDWGNTIIGTSDGGYAMAGYSRSSDIDVSANNGDWDFWIIRIDEAGNLLWEKNYGGTLNDEATSIQQTVDGGFVVAGATFSNDGDVGNNNGEEDFWIIKLDASGNLQWEQTYGGNLVDRAESIKQTADGGYFVAGFSASQNGDVSNNFGNFDFWLIRLDSGGNLLWENNYGGSGPDWAFELEIDDDGNVIMAGSTISNDNEILDNNGFYDYWVVKADATNGDLIWSKNFGGSGEDRSYFIKKAPDNTFYISGSSYSSNADVSGNFGSSDFWIVKIDTDGNLLWEKNLGGQGSEWAWALELTDDLGIVAVGRSNTNNATGYVSNNNGSNDFWLVKLSEFGVLEWENNFGGSNSEVPYSIVKTADGGFIIGGYSESSDFDVEDNYGDWDYWVLKLRPREIELNLGNDTTLCTAETHLLDAGVGEDASYQWQDASADSTFLITEEGMYQVTVTAGECVLEDSLFASYIDIEAVDLGPDTAFCFSEIEPYFLDASVPDADAYLWSNGSTDSTLTILQGGRYSVAVDILGCISTDTIDISFNNPQVDLGRDTFKCEGEPLTLSAFYPDAEYLWSDGSTDRKLIVFDTGTYSVIVDLNGCIETDTIHVGLCEKAGDPCLLFPNAFTPNGDGLNDDFRPVAYCRFDTYRFLIYNRWGEKLFITDNTNEGWNGFYKNQKPIKGVYTYIAEYEYQLNGETIRETVRGVFALVL